jgi:hypothetical protein
MRAFAGLAIVVALGCGRIHYAREDGPTRMDGGGAGDARAGIDARTGTDASIDGSLQDAPTGIDVPAIDGGMDAGIDGGGPTDGGRADAPPGGCRSPTPVDDGTRIGVTTCGGVDDFSTSCTPAGTPEAYFFLTVPPATTVTFDVGAEFTFVLNESPHDHCPLRVFFCRNMAHEWTNGTSSPVDFTFALERTAGGCADTTLDVSFRPLP